METQQRTTSPHSVRQLDVAPTPHVEGAGDVSLHQFEL